MSNPVTATVAPNTDGTTTPRELGTGLHEIVEQIAPSANVNVAFDTPHIVGDHTPIPVAQVSYGFGGGSGGGPARPTVEHGSAGGSTAAGGSGSGAAGGLSVRPIGVVDVSPADARVLPLVDMPAHQPHRAVVEPRSAHWQSYHRSFIETVRELTGAAALVTSRYACAVSDADQAGGPPLTRAGGSRNLGSADTWC
jgi:uncharacterized spore protein YtfJ